MGEGRRMNKRTKKEILKEFSITEDSVDTETVTAHETLSIVLSDVHEVL